jgi:hypothetical protein
MVMKAGRLEPRRGPGELFDDADSIIGSVFGSVKINAAGQVVTSALSPGVPDKSSGRVVAPGLE